MKTPSDDLFRLIQSLSPQEKIGFKKYAKRDSKTNNHYILLFDAINKMKQYDEAALRSKLKHHPLILKNLKRIKHFTFESILNSLAEYFSNNTIQSTIRGYLHRAEILAQKNHLELAHKILDKADKFAQKYEQLEYILLISKMRSDISMITDEVNSIQTYKTRMIPGDLRAMKRINNKIELRNLVYSIRLAFLKNGINPIKAKRASWNARLLSTHSESKDQTLEAKYLFNHANFLLSFSVEHPRRKDLFRHKKWVEDIETSQSKEHIAETYLLALSQLIALYSRFSESFEVNTVMQKAISFYRTLPNKSKSATISNALLRVMINYTYCWIAWNKLENIANTWDILSDTISIPKQSVNVAKILYANLAHVYLLLGRSKDSLKYVQKIIEESDTEHRIDLQADLRVYRLIIYYDLNDPDHLEHLVKSTERWLKKYSKYSKQQEAEIELFKRLIKGFRDEKQKKEVLQKFKEKLQQFESSKHLLPSILIPWLSSKIKNTSLANEIKYSSH